VVAGAGGAALVPFLGCGGAHLRAAVAALEALSSEGGEEGSPAAGSSSARRIVADLYLLFPSAVAEALERRGEEGEEEDSDDDDDDDGDDAAGDGGGENCGPRCRRPSWLQGAALRATARSGSTLAPHVLRAMAAVTATTLSPLLSPQQQALAEDEAQQQQQQRPAASAATTAAAAALASLLSLARAHPAPVAACLGACAASAADALGYLDTAATPEAREGVLGALERATAVVDELRETLLLADEEQRRPRAAAGGNALRAATAAASDVLSSAASALGRLRPQLRGEAAAIRLARAFAGVAAWVAEAEEEAGGGETQGEEGNDDDDGSGGGVGGVGSDGDDETPRAPLLLLRPSLCAAVRGLNVDLASAFPMVPSVGASVSALLGNDGGEGEENGNRLLSHSAAAAVAAARAHASAAAAAARALSRASLRSSDEAAGHPALAALSGSLEALSRGPSSSSPLAAADARVLRRISRAALAALRLAAAGLLPARAAASLLDAALRCLTPAAALPASLGGSRAREALAEVASRAVRPFSPGRKRSSACTAAAAAAAAAASHASSWLPLRSGDAAVADAVALLRAGCAGDISAWAPAMPEV
jgi:hypothetical protein